MSPTLALWAVKAALVDTVLPSLYPGVQVTWGIPVVHQEADIISVLDGSSTIDIETASRYLDEDASLMIRVSCSRAGGDEAQRAASEAALAYLATLATYVQTRPNETLGGVCRWARVTAYALTEDGDDRQDDDPAPSRLAEIIATLTIRART